MERLSLARYFRDGFVTGIPVLAGERLERVRAAVDHVRDNLDRYAERLYEVEQAYAERPDEVVCHFLGGWLVHDALRELVFDPAVTVPLARCLGVRRLRFWHDQVFYKPPRHPAPVPWHQDYSYWTRTAPACHVTMNIMLDDADPDSGCVHFVPGSHRWGLLPKVPFDAPIDAIEAHLTEAQKAAPRVPAILRAGEASIHHSHTLHGSWGNHSDRPRRAIVLNYMGPDVRSADGDTPPLRGVPRVPAGAVIEGEHFPIVLDLDRPR